jgi:ABC-2 type transport system ATP-binding protein
MAHATMLYDELNGMENLRYFASLYGITGSDAENAASEAMRTVALDPALKRTVAHYSQGMRQRLALARAIIHGPSLLLLDEPFSNLDSHSAAQMVEVLSAQRDLGMCVLLVTHQPSLLNDVADFNLHIDGGIATMRRFADRQRAIARVDSASEVVR